MPFGQLAHAGTTSNGFTFTSMGCNIWFYVAYGAQIVVLARPKAPLDDLTADAISSMMSSTMSAGPGITLQDRCDVGTVLLRAGDFL